MKKLAWWFRIVGAIYILLGIGFIPTLNAARLPMMIPDFDAPIGGVAYRGILDFTFMFGFEMMVVGSFLLHASRTPRHNLNLVWLIVWLEVVRGILHDMYMISQGYDLAFMLGFTLLHLVIISTGVLFTRGKGEGIGSEMTGRLSSHRL